MKVQQKIIFNLMNINNEDTGLDTNLSRCG
jgi:hypothetical protein